MRSSRAIIAPSGSPLAMPLPAVTMSGMTPSCSIANQVTLASAWSTFRPPTWLPRSGCSASSGSSDGAARTARSAARSAVLRTLALKARRVQP